MKITQKTAKKFHLPLMVHIDDRDHCISPSLTEKFLPLLESDHILGYFHTSHLGNVFGDDQKVIPEFV